MDGLHVVVGATGGTGRVVLRELRASGRRVRAVNRSGQLPGAPGVEVVAADATDAGQMRWACAGAAVVYHCVNPPFLRWRELFPATVDGVLAGAAAADAVVVFADDTWMYGRVTEPMTEDTAWRPVGAHGVLRAWLAERVLAAHHRGEVRTVIGRAGELYGPAVESLLGHNLFGAASAGRTARWLGRLDQPLTPAFVDDFARALITLGRHPAAYGTVWHVPHPEPTTGRGFVDAVFAAAGTRARVTAHGPATVRALGLVSPVVRQGADLLYQFTMPFVVDGTRFQDTFGVKATPVDEAVRTTLDWYRANPRRRSLGR
jgi:nucleoside-diphosphate-sugar epimerase